MPTLRVNSNDSLAVLFDADNANPAIIEGLLAEIAKLGIASVKRIYGNWTSNQLSSWKDALRRVRIDVLHNQAEFRCPADIDIHLDASGGDPPAVEQVSRRRQQFTSLACKRKQNRRWRRRRWTT